MGIKNHLKDVKRISHIINVLFQEDLGYVVSDLGFKKYLPFFHKFMIHKFKKTKKPEVKVRKVLERLGGSFVKLGQLLSIRPDLVPKEYCDEFSKLQDKVKPMPYSTVKQIIESELKKPINSIFSSFEKEPLGSASIGQVHKAKLKNGKIVVVKVKRKGIVEQFESDIHIFYFFAKRFDKHYQLKNISAEDLVSEFEKYTKKELNYIEESKNINDFYNIFKSNKHISIPKVYDKYTTQSILVMEFMHGQKLSELLDKKKNFNRKQISKLCVDCIISQVFDYGIFHADMHPGNIIVKKDSISLIDFGITGRLNRKILTKGLELYINLISGDSDSIAKTLLSIGKPSKDTDFDVFKSEIDEIVKELYGARLKEINVPSLIHKSLHAAISNNIAIPTDLILFAKALLSVEGTCRSINPDFNFVAYSKPYIAKLVKKNKSPKVLINRFIKESSNLKSLIFELPDHAASLIDKIKNGTIKVDIDDTDIRKLSLEIDKSSNRVSFGIVIASLIIGASLIMNLKTQPSFLGYPILTLLLFFIAITLAMFMFFSMLNEGKNL